MSSQSRLIGCRHLDCFEVLRRNELELGIYHAKDEDTNVSLDNRLCLILKLGRVINAAQSRVGGGGVIT